MSDTENTNLTAHQSLDIITSMIQQAQGNVRRKSFFFLFWGWIVVLANIGVYVLIQINYPMPYIVWSITIPAWIYTMYKARKLRKEGDLITHLDRITMWVWISYGICVFTFVGFGSKLNYQLNPLILTMGTIPTLVSGIILRFPPLLAGSGFLWSLGIVSFLVPIEFQNLVGALAVTCGYLIPGYILKGRKQN